MDRLFQVASSVQFPAEPQVNLAQPVGLAQDHLARRWDREAEAE
jgi:hypothetical protein